MAEQAPSVGRIVHFVYGERHVPAIITDPAFVVPEGAGEMTGQALTVFPVGEPSFTTVALQDATDNPIGGSWHWPEFVPPRSDERRNYGTSDHPMTKAEADAAGPGVSGETGAK